VGLIYLPAGKITRRVLFYGLVLAEKRIAFTD